MLFWQVLPRATITSLAAAHWLLLMLLLRSFSPHVRLLDRDSPRRVRVALALPPLVLSLRIGQLLLGPPSSPMKPPWSHWLLRLALCRTNYQSFLYSRTRS